MAEKISVKEIATKAKKSKAQLDNDAKAAEEMGKEELDVVEETKASLAPAFEESVESGVVKTVSNEDIRVKLESNAKKPRLEGNWIKISSKAELVKYEMEGRLKGWDPVKSEVLLKD